MQVCDILQLSSIGRRDSLWSYRMGFIQVMLQSFRNIVKVSPFRRINYDVFFSQDFLKFQCLPYTLFIPFSLRWTGQSLHTIFPIFFPGGFVHIRIDMKHGERLLFRRCLSNRKRDLFFDDMPMHPINLLLTVIMIPNLLVFTWYIEWLSWQFKHILFENTTWSFLALILFLKELFSLFYFILPFLLLLHGCPHDERAEVTIFHQFLKLLCGKFKDHTFSRWYLCCLGSLDLR